MADDLVFSKEKLTQLSSTKKTTTVEAAFDSDESDWSDNENENTSVVKQAVSGDAQASRKSPPIFSGVRKASTDFQKEGNSAGFENKAFDSLSKRQNSLSPVKDEQRRLSSSPYFIKENNSFGESKSFNKKIEKVPSETLDDDWDEESCIVNINSPKVNGKSIVENNNKTAFFQPSSSNFKQHVRKQGSTERGKPNMVDWSETFSDGASEAGNVEFDNIENLPADEEPEPFKSEVVHEKVKEIIAENPDMSGTFFENRKSTSPSLISSAVKRTPEEFLQVGVTPPSPATTISTEKAEASLENLDYSNPTVGSISNEFGTKSEKSLPSPSSAAQLFMAASSSTSPYVQVAMESSKSNVDLTRASNPYLVEAPKPKKKSKPSSAKHMLTRLFSSDGEKNSKDKNPVSEQPVRKTSEPIPLSTLLLNTPPKVPESGRSDLLQNRHTTSTPGISPLIPPRYFPPDSNIGRQEYPIHGGDGDAAPVAPGSKKRKGFLGKMKKTFGITSSKGSKMRSSESLKNLPVITTTTFPGDSGISTENNAGDRMIAVHTSGRPANEVIVDLLKEGKKYLENTSTNARDAIQSGNYEQRNKSATSNDRLKRYSSADDFLTSSVGSSRLANSEISLTDDQQATTETDSRRMHYSQALESSPNRQVMYNLVEDFCCVLDKSFGEQDRLKHVNRNLFSEIDQLRGALDCCEAGKTELERQFQEMQGEFQKLKFSLEEECETRSNLEGIVCELKAQMERQDEIVNGALAEKAELRTTLKQMETDNWNFKNQISDFAAEREELAQSVRGFEETRSKCTELQNALVDCCEKHDLMEKEIVGLREENNEIRLKLDSIVFEKNQEINNIFKNEVLSLREENNETKMKLDTCEFEKNKLINEIQILKQEFAVEKADLETKISELLEGISTLEKSKGEICKHTSSVLAAHHEEMDNLRAESVSFKEKYEQEHKIREGLENRLRLANSAVAFHTAEEIERSPPGSFPLNNSSTQGSLYQRLASSSEPPSLSPSSIRGNRDNLKTGG